MKTAVEWLMNKYISQNGIIAAADYHTAKEMEKNQIIDAYKEGMGNVDGWIVDENGVEQYYNETFKKK